MNGKANAAAPTAGYTSAPYTTPAGWAAAALERIIPYALPKAFEYAVAAMEDKEVAKRENTAKVIGLFGERALPYLVQKVTDESEDRGVRTQAAHGVRFLAPHSDTAFDELEALLISRFPETRRYAVRAVRHWGERAVGAIRALLRTERNQWVIRDAANALEEIGPAAIDSVPALISLLGEDRTSGHPNWSAVYARSALVKITGQEFERHERSRWEEWLESQRR